MDLAENAADGRRLKVVADDLPLFGGAQLAIDTTLVSTFHANGLPRRVGVDGAAFKQRDIAKSGDTGQVVGHVCRGGVWPLVEGDSVFRELIGPSEGTF